MLISEYHLKHFSKSYRQKLDQKIIKTIIQIEKAIKEQISDIKRVLNVFKKHFINASIYRFN